MKLIGSATVVVREMFFVFILAYFSIFCGVLNKIVITLALVAYGMIMTNAVPGVS